jgi:hypothetical protein
MLAPGEYLTCPAPTEQHRVPIQKQLVTETLAQRPTVLSAATEEPENRSFLMILLRALGSVHS